MKRNKLSDRLFQAGVVGVVGGAIVASPADEAAIAVSTGGIGLVAAPAQAAATGVAGATGIAGGATLIAASYLLAKVGL